MVRDYMRMLYVDAARMQQEQDREELEKRRSGMPGSIRRNGKWTRERKDGPMAYQAKAALFVWMVRER